MGKYFVNSEDGFKTFETLKEQSIYANTLIESYKSTCEPWPREVEDIVSGVIITKATAVNIRNKPNKLEKGFDEDGLYWPNGMDSICDYKMIKVK